MHIICSCSLGSKSGCVHTATLDSPYCCCACRWDEQRYGLEYDLGLFNVVSVSDFSMGAMENKSLNIFNSRLVLASPETATDADFARIQGVIGHEYFHNWTGNRVTCRDWFQLTLKEGLTVYRDSEFTSDMTSRAVKRIEDVMMMRTAQFSQDAGPMAHPIRPDSYIKMDNFYTVTVYEKVCFDYALLHVPHISWCYLAKSMASSELFVDSSWYVFCIQVTAFCTTPKHWFSIPAFSG